MSTKRNHTVTILFMAGFLPMLFAVIYYFINDNNQNRVNYGEFVTPATQLKSLNIETPNSFVNAGGEDRKWTFLVSASECDISLELCKKGVLMTHQIHQLLGKHYSRFQRFLLFSDKQILVDVKSSLDNKKWNFWQISDDKLQNIRAKLKLQPVFLLIIDPLGNIVFKYSDFSKPKKILKDARRLLKASRIG